MLAEIQQTENENEKNKYRNHVSTQYDRFRNKLR